MNRILTACSVAIMSVMGLSACVSPPKQSVESLKAATYAVDKSHATLTFQVKHFGLSWYTMRFNEFDIALDFNPDAPETSTVKAIIDPTSIDVWIPEGQDECLNELAYDGKFLDANTYPQILFESTAIEVTGDNIGVMTGNLTLKGITKPISMNVTFNGSNTFPWAPGQKILGFSADGSFMRSEFGLDAMVPNTVSDETRFTIEAEFHQSDAAED